MSNVGAAVLAVIVGTIVYVFGRMIERAFIEPLNDYRRLVMDIAGALALHGDYWANTGAWDALRSSGAVADNQLYNQWYSDLSRATSEASRDLRAKGAQLGAYARTIRWYWLLARLGRCQSATMSCALLASL